jgi:RNA-directed DNA polymerase
MQRLREKVADGPLLQLIASFLKAGVLEDLREWAPTAGAPQGAVLSPLLSNIYLDPLDHLLAAQGLAMVRYADDFVILCRTRQEADRALAVVQEWVASNGLRLHPDKTRIVDTAADAFDFLGYRFERARRSPRPKSLASLKDAVRSKTKRTDGRSLGCILADLNRTLYGWYGYFWRSHERVFSRLDGWIRRRLRSLLRKRAGLPGVSRHGADEARWPVAFFAAQGLFSLKAAHAAAVNPR